MSRLVDSEKWRGRRESLWKFWEHGVTSSFLTNFLTCREQARLIYVEGWTSRRVPLAIEFGQCVHWCLEQLYSVRRPDVLNGLREGPMQPLVARTIRDYETKWKVETLAPSEAQLEQQEKVLGMAEIVLLPYLRRWAGDFTGKYTWRNPTVAPKAWESFEETFNIPYKFADGKLACLRGRRDGVFRDARGKLWVFDTKCLSVIDDDDILDTLPVNLQQMLYATVTRHEYEEVPAGVVLNVVRRPGQRWLKDDTLTSFLERVRKDVENPARWDHYFIRYQMGVTGKELDAWRAAQLSPLMDDVRGWWEGTAAHYMNPNALISKYGRAALFEPLTKGDYSGCFRRTNAFSELADI